MSDMMIRAVLVSVNRDFDGAAKFISRSRPEFLCFFGPADIQKRVEAHIQTHVEKLPKKWDWIEMPASGEINAVCRRVDDRVSELLRAWSLEGHDLWVDYSDGEGEGVLGLILATTQLGCRLIRRRGDADPPWDEVNPWDELAPIERKKAYRLFNAGHWMAAADLLLTLSNRVSAGLRPTYKALSELASGYGLWDAFRHRDAWNKLKEAHKSLGLSALWGGPPGLKEVLDQVKTHIGRLEKWCLDPRPVRAGAPSEFLAAAKRRAVARRYDEAVAVIWRAIAAHAHVRLEACKMDPSDVAQDKIPEGIRMTYTARYSSELDGKIRPDVIGAYKLLKAAGDPAGETFTQLWEEIKFLQEAWNRTVLSYGAEPIKDDLYRRALSMALKLTQTQESSLVEFPRL
jgi:CRISPR-associated protein (TIGR02710 family)